MTPFDLPIAAKIRWRMAYDRNPLLPVLQDKLAVKRYAAEKGVPSAKVIFQTDNPEKIPFSDLPEKCFIKANHGCNWNILKYGSRYIDFRNGHSVTDLNGFYKLSSNGATELQHAEVIKITSEWLNTSYRPVEWAYKNIVPAIFAEELIEPEAGRETLDYRLYTFRGRVAVINIGSPSMRKKKENIFFTPKWKKITLKNNFEKEPAIIPEMPPFLPEMIEAAERLGRDVDFVRIDFFADHRQFYLSEMTLYPFGGKDNRPTSDHSFNLFLGKQWKLGLWQNIQALWLENQYLDANPDVRSSGIHTLLHSLQSGIRENRAPLPVQATRNTPIITQHHQNNDFQIINIDYTIKVVYPSRLRGQFVHSSGTLEFINTFFSEIYIINLSRREDRLIRILQIINGLNLRVQIVEAIDGNALPHLYEYRQYAKLPTGAQNAPPFERESGNKTIIGPGAWGLLKTYRMILCDAVSKGHQSILVLEDDAVFLRDFHNRFLKFIESIGDRSWKVLALGVAQHKWEVPANLFYADDSVRKYAPEQPWYHPVTSKGTFALGIHHFAFPMLIEEMEKMNQPADHAFRPVYAAYPRECFVAQPNLIIADITDSDIEQLSSTWKEGFNKRQKWEHILYEFTRHQTLVSVIMPAYNAEKTIGLSLKSLLRQTWPWLEIIVVDDCSTDQTGEIVTSLAMQDSRIRYYRQETNGGAYIARNRAIRESKGRYIANMDADDVALSTRIHKQILPILMGQARFTLAYMVRSFCPPETLASEDDQELLQIAGTFLPSDKTEDEMAALRPRISLPSFLTEKSLFEKHGLYIEERFSADAEFIERILFYENGITITLDSAGVLNYLVHHPQIGNLFSLLTEVLYLSTNRTENNLTRQNLPKSPLRIEFQKRWRDDFTENIRLRYPVLIPCKVNQ